MKWELKIHVLPRGLNVLKVSGEIVVPKTSEKFVPLAIAVELLGLARSAAKLNWIRIIK